MTGLDPFAPVILSDHVLARIRERVGHDLPAGDVRAEVRIGLLAGRVSERRPDWTSGRTDGGCSYVWDADASRCWCVRPARGGERGNVVLTVLLGRDEQSRIAQARLLKWQR